MAMDSGCSFYVSSLETSRLNQRSEEVETSVALSAVTFLGPQTAGLFCGALRLLERRGAALEILGGPFQRMLVTGGGSSRLTQRAERDGQRSLDVIAAFGGHLWTAEMGDTPTGKVVGAAVPALEASAIVQSTYIALLSSVALGAGRWRSDWGSGCRWSLLSQAYSKGQEDQNQVKQDMQLGKGRAQQQAATARNNAQDGDALAATTRR
jgi:hypothetical protein